MDLVGPTNFQDLPKHAKGLVNRVRATCFSDWSGLAETRAKRVLDAPHRMAKMFRKKCPKDRRKAKTPGIVSIESFLSSENPMDLKSMNTKNSAVDLRGAFLLQLKKDHPTGLSASLRIPVK